MARQRIGQIGVVPARQGERDVADQLEARQAVAERLLHRAQQLHRVLDIRHARERRHVRRRRGKELQHGRGDDAERAFGADEQLLQIVAGVVLAQTAQAVPDAPVGEHHFEAERQLARIAEAQHRGAAGVGRQVAADRAASFGRERQREHTGRPPPRPPARACSVTPASTVIVALAASTARTRFSRDERQHDLVAAAHRGVAPPHMPGVAALRDDRHVPASRTDAHDRGDFLGRSAAARRRARRRDSGRANRRDTVRCRPAAVRT